MNEHEASVANKLTAKGSPLWTILALREMRKREIPKGAGVKKVAAIVVPSSLITVGGIIARFQGWW